MLKSGSRVSQDNNGVRKGKQDSTMVINLEENNFIDNLLVLLQFMQNNFDKIKINTKRRCLQITSSNMPLDTKQRLIVQELLKKITNCRINVDKNKFYIF